MTSTKLPAEPWTFTTEPLQLTTEPGKYAGVRSQRVRVHTDHPSGRGTSAEVWLTVHEPDADGVTRLTLASYTHRFRLDYVHAGKGGAGLSITVESIETAGELPPEFADPDPVELAPVGRRGDAGDAL